MSSYVYPNNILGLSFGCVRAPDWNTGFQKALSGKQSTIAYRVYPDIHFELDYELLRDDTATSDLKALAGLVGSLAGRYDSFLFTDPDFNTVTGQSFGTGNASTTAFQLVATYGNSGSPGYTDIIQNVQGTPAVYQTRYGLAEICESQAKQNLLVESNLFNNASYWTATSVTFSTGQTSPDGLNNAINVIETTANTEHLVAEGISLTAGVTYTLSVWVRGSASRYLQMQIYSPADGAEAAYDYNGGTAPSAGAVGTGTSVAADMVAYNAGAGGGSGYRCRLTFTCGTTGVHQIYLGLSNVKSAGASYAGDGSSYVTLWGAQLENNFRASLYVPTGGSASTNQPDYSLGSTGIVTFTVAPINNAALTWSGSFYYRCRFDEDSFSYTKFMNQWWTAKVKFTSFIL